MKILIAEDNEILSNNIHKFLSLEEIDSEQLFSGDRVLYEIIENNYDLVILDIGLPGIDGLSLCKKIRESGKNIPILILTARNTKQDKKAGFELGADDYLIKPFDYDELVLRVRALVRRNYAVKSNNLIIDDLEIQLDFKKVYKNQKEIHMSSLEINLLIYLVQNKGRIISKEELLEKVWGEYNAFEMSRTVDVYIGYIRKKLGKNIIETVRGTGYILN